MSSGLKSTWYEITAGSYGADYIDVPLTEPITNPDKIFFYSADGIKSVRNGNSGNNHSTRGGNDVTYTILDANTVRVERVRDIHDSIKPAFGVVEVGSDINVYTYHLQILANETTLTVATGFDPTKCVAFVSSQEGPHSYNRGITGRLAAVRLNADGDIQCQRLPDTFSTGFCVTVLEFSSPDVEVATYFNPALSVSSTTQNITLDNSVTDINKTMLFTDFGRPYGSLLCRTNRINNNTLSVNSGASTGTIPYSASVVYSKDYTTRTIDVSRPGESYTYPITYVSHNAPNINNSMITYSSSYDAHSTDSNGNVPLCMLNPINTNQLLMKTPFMYYTRSSLFRSSVTITETLGPTASVSLDVELYADIEASSSVTTSITKLKTFDADITNVSQVEANIDVEEGYSEVTLDAAIDATSANISALTRDRGVTATIETLSSSFSSLNNVYDLSLETSASSNVLATIEKTVNVESSVESATNVNGILTSTLGLSSEINTESSAWGYIALAGGFDSFVGANTDVSASMSCVKSLTSETNGISYTQATSVKNMLFESSINSATTIESTITKASSLNAIINSNTGINAQINKSFTISADINNSTSVNATIERDRLLNAIANNLTQVHASSVVSYAFDASINSNTVLDLTLTRDRSVAIEIDVLTSTDASLTRNRTFTATINTASDVDVIIRRIGSYIDSLYVDSTSQTITINGNTITIGEATTTTPLTLADSTDITLNDAQTTTINVDEDGTN